ncbi:hypothetical protein [Okeania sp. KiyG1]|uniref:hypothetical protein n=1 Tax=Okeania sp. KiyG1 TaxID=2720165 RepID=UPI001922BE80|nr:hypothetical protein [Okeania sp. KiyG1]
MAQRIFFSLGIMCKLIHRVKTLFIQQLYKRTALVLSIMFCIGIVAGLWNTHLLSSKLIKSKVLQNASHYAQTIQAARTLYSEVATRAKTVEGITITHDYKNIEGG